MYSIFAGDVCIYDDTSDDKNLKVINPTLTLADCSAGSLEMTLHQNNVGFSLIEKMKTKIIVKKHDIEFWSGRVLNDGSGFTKLRKVFCEGELAYLNDTTQPPMQYQDYTVRGFLEALVTIHNSKVTKDKQFVVGVVTVTDPNDSIYRYTNYEKTIECINKKLIEVFGGHLRVRKENGVRYIDYLADYPNTNTQKIEFGKNLLDFTKTEDMSEYATVIVPLGARLETSPIEALDAYLTVESVNSGSKYVKSSSAITEYGWIEKVVKWDDVTVASNLLTKAEKYLTDIQFESMVIEVSAIDLHYLDVDVESFKLLDQIQVVSAPHGMDRYFPLSKITIPLANVENTTFTLGTTVSRALTDVNNKVNANIISMIDNLPKKSEILDQAQTNATNLMNMISNGFITIIKGQNGSQELLVTDNTNYLSAQKVWRWNINGLAYSSTGYNGTYGLALTMDGAIVADMIKTGILNGNLIRAGIIRANNGNSYWNLETGEVYMEAVETQLTQIKSDMVTLTEDYNLFTQSATNKFESLQNQVDGSITTWFYNVPPLATNEPAVNWTTTDLKNIHLGDLYYDTFTGYAYRYQVLENVYSWQRLTDTDVTKALDDASKAKDVADSKRRVFVATPTTPYEVGDLWTQGVTGDIMRCKTTKLLGSYSVSDWEKAGKYTDDTAVNNLQIGGRNMFQNSNFWNGTTGWRGNRSSPECLVDATYGHCLKITCTGVNYGVNQYPGTVAGKRYSFGVWLKADAACTIRLTLESGSKYVDVSVTTAWQYFKLESTTAAGANAAVIYPQSTCVFYVANAKFEEGDKCTPWSPAPEDTNALIAAAQLKADNAQGTANSAQSVATEAAGNAASALTKLDDMSSDLKITPSEKQMLYKEWQAIVSEKTLNYTQADTFGITTEKTAYGTKYTALNTYVNTTYPLFADLNTTTTIDSGDTMRTKYKEYYDARTVLLNAIAAKTKKLADDARNNLDNLQIGGVNILHNSNFWNGSTGWSCNYSATFICEEDTMYGHHLKVTGTQATYGAYQYPSPSIIAGKRYSFGVWLKADTACNITIGIENTNLVTANVTTTWQYFKVESRTAAGNNAIIIYPQSACVFYIANAKLEEGDKCTPWTLSPTDNGALIAAAQAKADGAANDVVTINTKLSDIASDSMLTPSEKQTIRKEWDTIYGEYSANITQATNFGITTEKTNYTNALATLGTYLNAGTVYSISATIPTWIADGNLSITTPIVGSTFRANFTAFYSVRQQLLNAITAKAKAAADDMVIGGRNIALMSGAYTRSSTSKWIIDDPISWKNEMFDGYTRFTKLNAVTGKWVRLPLSMILTQNQIYTISIKFKKSTTSDFNIYMAQSGSTGNVPSMGTVTGITANTLQERVFTFTASTSVTNQIMFTSTAFVTVNESFDIYSIKLEKGNKATDWTPAPEDVQSNTDALNFSFTNIVGGTISGDTFTKTATSGWSNSGFSNSYKFYNGDSVEFKITNGSQVMCGLSTTDTNQDFTSINYAIYADTGGSIYIYENGTSKYKVLNTWVASDIFAIKISENKVYYIRNGSVFYISLVAPTLPLVLDTSLYMSSSSVSIKYGMVDSLKAYTEAKTTASNIVSTINQTAEAIKIAANKLDLTGLVTIANLGIAGTTTINGNNIKTGAIQSSNYSTTAPFAGSRLDLINGSFDSAYFKWDSMGRFTASAGTIGLWTVDSASGGFIYNNVSKGEVGGQKFIELNLGSVTNFGDYNINTRLTPYEISFGRVYPYGKGSINFQYRDYTMMTADGIFYWHNGTSMNDQTLEASMKIQSYTGHDGVVTGLNFNSPTTFRFNNNIDLCGRALWASNVEVTSNVIAQGLVCRSGITAYYNATQAVFFSGGQLLSLYLNAQNAGWI